MDIIFAIMFFLIIFPLGFALGQLVLHYEDWRYFTHFIYLCRRYNVKWKMTIFPFRSCVRVHYDKFTGEIEAPMLISGLPINSTNYIIFLHELGHWVFDFKEKDIQSVEAISEREQKHIMLKEIRAWRFADKANKHAPKEDLIRICEPCLGSYAKDTKCSYEALQRLHMWYDYVYSLKGDI